MNNVLSNKSSEVTALANGAHASEAPSHCYKTNTTDCRHIGGAQRTKTV